VCVVDTGVDLTTDAAPAVVERHSVFGGTTDDVGGSGLAKHGTLVAGVIASQLDGRDSVGIWPHARIVSVRVFDGSGGGTTTAAIITALERCRERGAQVVNVSLAGLDHETAVDLARLDNRITGLRTERGISVVAGVGNNGGPVGYPARFGHVVAVGAADATGALCPFSSRGPELDISALGCDVKLSWPYGGTGRGSGTSYSTPIVTGVLAALRAYRPDLDASHAEDLLTATMDGGRLNAAKAFRAAGLDRLVSPPIMPSVPLPVPPASSPAAARQRFVDRLRELGVRSPRVISAVHRRGTLEIRTPRPPDFARAIFRIGRRTYSRANGRLRVRMRRAPLRASVSFYVAGVGRTAATRFRVRSMGAASKSSARTLKSRT
jgi:subtilisin family serine protease